MAEIIRKAKKSKKQRKHGRGLRVGGQCARYKNEGRRERNKLRRLVKHLRRHPGDGSAKEAVARLAPGALPVQWRNGNAAVCKTAMSQFDSGLHLHALVAQLVEQRFSKLPVASSSLAESPKVP